VSLRKRELSVRVALGAQRSNILKPVIQHGFKIAGIGLLIGLVGALALNRLIESMLFGVSAADAISFGGSVLLLSCVGFIASLIPA